MITALAATFAAVAALLADDRSTFDWTSFAVTFFAAFVTGLSVLLWPQPRALVRPSPFLRQARSTVTGQDSHARPQQPAEHGSTAQPASGNFDSPPPDSPPPDSATKAARRVELAALTTSGVSGLTVDRGSSGDFDIYAATQVGLQHAKDGHTREDAYAIGGDPDRGWVFLAVADGLGSAVNSHAAAQLASRTAIRVLREQVPSIHPAGLRSEWIGMAAAITAEVAAGLEPAAVDDFAVRLGYEAVGPAHGKRSAPACTLLFAALGPVAPDGYPLLWGAVGDCELLLVDVGSGQQHWLTYNATKQRGGMVSNATLAMPRDYREVTGGYQVVAADAMTVLASDGMAEAIRLVPEQYRDLLPQVAGPSPAEWMFGELVGFQLPGLHDDRTLVVALPRRSRPDASAKSGGARR